MNTPLYFTKMNGAGNDFIIIDNINHEARIEFSVSIIKKLCNRFRGAGADGLFIIEKSSVEGINFSLKFYNSDGSTGSLCGNGSRCIIRYAFEKKLYSSNQVKFFFREEIFTGSVLDSQMVQFNLNEPAKIKKGFKIKAANQLMPAFYANTGSEHIVIDINQVERFPNKKLVYYDDINDFPVIELGREIRNHKDFSPLGVNVNFIELKEERVFIRTYERGVESETLACGTGSTAAALYCFIVLGKNPPFVFNTRGGDLLEIDFKIKENKICDLRLIGPAEINYNGLFNVDLLN